MSSRAGHRRISVPSPDNDEVASPCISVCRMVERTGLCQGCARTLEEIAAWSTMSPADKRAVWEKLALRREPGSPPA